MNNNEPHTAVAARLSEAPSEQLDVNAMSVLLAISLLAILVPVAVSVSPVVVLINLLIGLPILISGIINLILIIR